ICVSGSPQGLLSLRLGRNVIYLNESKAGQYCGNVSSVGLITPDPWRIELRAATGLSTQSDYRYQPSGSTCDLKGLVHVARQGKQVNLALSCSAADCNERLHSCEQVTKVVYRAPSSSGPFTKIGEFKGARWADTMGQHAALYGILIKQAQSTSALPLLV